MTLLILDPPAILLPCPGGPRCPCGGPGLALPLTGGSPHAARPQAVWWAPVGWKRVGPGWAPVVGEA